MKAIDIIGKKFGRLTVISFSHSNGYRKYFLCKCECGKEKIIYKGSLLSGRTLSCGCFQKEQAKNIIHFLMIEAASIKYLLI